MATRKGILTSKASTKIIQKEKHEWCGEEDSGGQEIERTLEGDKRYERVLTKTKGAIKGVEREVKLKMQRR